MRDGGERTDTGPRIVRPSPWRNKDAKPPVRSMTKLLADSGGRITLQQRADGSILDVEHRAVDQVNPKISLKRKANGIARSPALVIGNDHAILAALAVIIRDR